MNWTPRRFVSPSAVVVLTHDGKEPGRVNGNRIWSLPFVLTYRVAHPKTTRLMIRTYRVYRDISEPTAPFISVRGERLYLTPSFTRKVLPS